MLSNNADFALRHLFDVVVFKANPFYLAHINSNY